MKYGIGCLFKIIGVHANKIATTKYCLIPLNNHINWHDAINKNMLPAIFVEYFFNVIIIHTQVGIAIINNHVL